jgi:hypothetical protein
MIFGKRSTAHESTDNHSYPRKSLVYQVAETLTWANRLFVADARLQTKSRPLRLDSGRLRADQTIADVYKSLRSNTPSASRSTAIRVPLPGGAQVNVIGLPAAA